MLKLTCSDDTLNKTDRKFILNMNVEYMLKIGFNFMQSNYHAIPAAVLVLVRKNPDHFLSGFTTL